LSARAHPWMCLQVRMSKRACACAPQAFMRVRIQICACECQNLYARSHAKIFMPVRILDLVAREHVEYCMCLRMSKISCTCAWDMAFGMWYCLRVRTSKCPCAYAAQAFMRVRILDHVCACACRIFPALANVKICLRVRMPIFECECACQNFYARAHSRSCLRVRMCNIACASACRILHARAHDRTCLRDRMFQNILKNFK
jgi:hypothetical protein